MRWSIMVNYLQSGSGKTNVTWAGGGSGACKTAFKTHMVITDRSGNKRKMSKVDGIHTWDKVEPGDKIRYNVFTGADDKKGDSDEYYLIASSLNWPYVISVYNEINQNMTPEQQALWDSNPAEFEKHLMSKLDESRIMLTVTSKINYTGDDGKQSKILNIPDSWASGPIQLAFIYGYDNDARKSDSARMWQNVLDVAGWVALAISVIVFFVGCGAATLVTAGAASAGCLALAGLAAASIAVDAAIMCQLAYEQYTQGLGAQISRNKYGCSFPEGAFVHTYSIILINKRVDPYANINIPAAQQNSAASSSSSSMSLVNPRTLMLLGAASGLFLLIWNVLGDESNG